MHMYRELEEVSLGDNAKCPICGKRILQNYDPRISVGLVICGTCGKFRIGGRAEHGLNGLRENGNTKLYKLSFALRSTSDRAFGKRDSSYFPVYSYEDFQKMIDRPEPSVQEKLNLLLRFLGSITDFPGQSREFDKEFDYSVACARNPSEAEFYLATLAEQRLVFPEASFTGSSKPRFKVTASGWNELDRIDKLGAESQNAFVAMSFHSDRDRFEKAISAAVRAAGYKPVRVDQIEHVNHIDDEIIARIRDSKFLISDFTLQRNGVYFEAGFMLGLGRPVIWLCEKSDLKNVHFDARQYNTIDYTDEENLRTRLQLRIEAILGRGPVG